MPTALSLSTGTSIKIRIFFFPRDKKISLEVVKSGLGGDETPGISILLCYAKKKQKWQLTEKAEQQRETDFRS